MTDTENKSRLDGFLPFVLSFLAFALLLCFPKTVGMGVRAGLELCYRAIIPSVFPFMVLSEILRGIDLTPLDRTAGRLLGALLRVSPLGGRVILLGILCGFPIGAKMTSELYADGQIEKGEAEKLLFLSACPSPAFVISGVGLSMLGDVRCGVMLFLILLLSTLAVGLLLPSVVINQSLRPAASRASSVSLVGAIKGAATGTLSVTAFITFFSVLSSLVSALISNPVISALVASVLEIGSGASASAALIPSSPRLASALVAFAVSFSGISVYLQSLAYIGETDLSPRLSLIGKILSSVLSTLLAFLLLG